MTASLRFVKRDPDPVYFKISQGYILCGHTIVMVGGRKKMTAGKILKKNIGEKMEKVKIKKSRGKK